MTRMSRRSRAGYSFVGLLVLALVLTVGVSAVAAQGTQADSPHPAHIHKGSCAQLDPNPQYPLKDVKARTKDDNKTPSSQDLKGALTATMVEYSQTKIDAKLDDILGDAHALNVHESTKNITHYIACGNIGGFVVDDTLIIGLNQLNNSGYSGIAVLEKKDDQTQVTVYLAKGLANAPTSGQQTPAPSPSPTPAGTPTA